jgi:uncharacterized circularly permuted ATP-grasp superfamily protein
VVKEVHGSGGYGMLIGPTSSKAEIAAFEKKLRAAGKLHRPAYAVALHRADLHQGGAGAAPCRSAALCAGVAQWHQHHAGGLTRVALKKGSLVVNSSQGGGTKDSWVLAE